MRLHFRSPSGIERLFRPGEELIFDVVAFHS